MVVIKWLNAEELSQPLSGLFLKILSSTAVQIDSASKETQDNFPLLHGPQLPGTLHSACWKQLFFFLLDAS